MDSRRTTTLKYLNENCNRKISKEVGNAGNNISPYIYNVFFFFHIYLKSTPFLAANLLINKYIPCILSIFYGLEISIDQS